MIWEEFHIMEKGGESGAKMPYAVKFRLAFIGDDQLAKNKCIYI